MIPSWVVVLTFGMLIGCVITCGALWILDGRELRKMARSFWESDRLHRESIRRLDEAVQNNRATSSPNTLPPR